MVTFLVIVNVLLLMLLGFSLFFMIRFMRYVLSIEDTITEAVQVHERTLATMENLYKIPLVYDSPHVQRAMKDILDDVKICNAATQQMAQQFLRLSKHQYIEEEKD